MELITVGREYQPGRAEPIWHNDKEVFLPEMGVHERFRLVLVEEGTGIVKIGEQRWSFIAPAVFCLNEKEMPHLENSISLHARAIYFHPRLINSRFTFTNIRGGENQFQVSDIQDWHMLETFTYRDRVYKGLLNVSLEAAQRISGLFDGIKLELANQSHYHWPCRARSFLQELLFALERIFTTGGVIDVTSLPETARDVEQIMLFLHVNYQRKISINELTRIFHMNRTTLMERFRKITSMTIITYLNNLRIQMACLMLADPDLSVSEVMERVGIKDITNFGRLFRRFTKFSPTEYRQKYLHAARPASQLEPQS